MTLTRVFIPITKAKGCYSSVASVSRLNGIVCCGIRFGQYAHVAYIGGATVGIYFFCTYYFTKVLMLPVEQMWYMEIIYLVIPGTLSVLFFDLADWKKVEV